MNESRQLLAQKSCTDKPSKHINLVALMRASGIPEEECAKVDGCHNTLWREVVCPDLIGITRESAWL